MTPRPEHHPDHYGVGLQAVALAAFLVACYAAAYAGQIATTPNIPTWYAGLEKPWFNPPSWVFAPVWALLYTMMAVAAWLVWRERDSERRIPALVAFFIQLVLNVGWPWAFFGGHNPIAGLTVILVLVAAILWTTVLFVRISRPAAWLMIPYLAWASFATLLNAAIVVLN